jgi:acyl dehydratase
MALRQDFLLATPAAEIPYRYTARDTILHSLGVGLGMDAMDRAQIAFVYGEEPKVFPTQSAAIGWVDLTRDPRFYDPAWGLDSNRIVVGESIVTQIRPLSPEGSGLARMYFAEVVDKGAGKAALIRTRKDLHDDAGTLLATLDTWLFVRGAGGFGGPSEGGPERVVIPERAADFTCALATPQTLALIYRLSLGDNNALHADPDHAKRVGFERPILHGIASLSIGAHAVLRSVLGYDPTRLKSASARFVAPVFPGDTLATDIWVEGNTALFRTRSAERNIAVMDGGKVVFWSGVEGVPSPMGRGPARLRA